MKKFRKLSLASQIFFLITTFTLLLILIQYLVYRFVFNGFYLEQQMAQMETQVNDYLLDLKADTEDSHFQTIFDFTSQSQSISLILDSDLNVVSNDYSYYSVEVTDTSTYEVYDIVLPETSSTIKLSDRISASIVPRSSGDAYDIYSLSINNEVQYELDCNDCITIKGIATKINAPQNLNIYFENNQIAISELFRLKTAYDLDLSVLDSKGLRFIHETEFSRNVTYLHKVSDDTYVMTIFVQESTENISNILGTYNFSIYFVMVTLAIIISVIVSNLISKPIKEIDDAAKEIASLNFEVKVRESQNRETSSLSDSINRIASNLKRNIDKLNARNQEVYKLYEDQMKQVELRKKFISAISHELKTPLMVINITAQGILDGIFDESETEQELNKILGEITNLDVMIKDLLDVYKLDDLNVEEDLQKINLKKMSDQTIESVENLLKAYKQQIQTSSARDSYIYANPKFMQMVLSNLITNAIKYTPNGERITVDIQSVRDKVIFKVTNYGTQIPEEALEHIWEPFYRVDESRTKSSKSKGSGLGLYIVSETLNAHGFQYGIKNIDNGVQAWFSAPKNQK